MKQLPLYVEQLVCCKQSERESLVATHATQWMPVSWAGIELVILFSSSS